MSSVVAFVSSDLGRPLHSLACVARLFNFGRFGSASNVISGPSMVRSTVRTLHSAEGSARI